MFDYTFRRTNETEVKLARKASKNGWVAHKRGWPDFWCESTSGEIVFVEVKPRNRNGKQKRLTRDQTDLMNFLSSKNIRCFVSDGESLEKYDEKKHGCRSMKKPINRWESP